MNKALVDYVRKQGGLVRTYNFNLTHDNIYGYAFDYDTDVTREFRVGAVAVFNNGENLCIIEDIFGCDSTDEELLESDEWLYVFGGEVLQNATLYNLCAFIEEYED